MTAPSLPSILNAAAKYYNAEPADVISHSRSYRLTRPRQVFIWLARKWTDHSTIELGKFLDGRDHTSICYAISEIQAALSGPSGDVVQRQINEIEADLPHMSAVVPVIPAEPEKWVIEFEDRMGRRDPEPWMRTMLKVALRRYGFRARSVKRIGVESANPQSVASAQRVLHNSARKEPSHV